MKVKALRLHIALTDEMQDPHSVGQAVIRAGTEIRGWASLHVPVDPRTEYPIAHGGTVVGGFQIVEVEIS